MLVDLMAIIALCNPYFFFFFFLHVLLIAIPIHCSAISCLKENSLNSRITDSSNSSALVSPSGVFELGFVTPEGKTGNSRYLGIWYYNQSNPKIIVWVANRDKPLLSSNASLVIQNGNAKLLDGKGIPYWSTNVGYSTLIPHSSSKNLSAISTLCLLDNGNLVLSGRPVRKEGDSIKYLWQSFNHPTDTFLPDMNLLDPSSSLNLTSWQNHNDPAQGNFTFQLQPDHVNDLVIVETGNSHYWESEKYPFDTNASELYKMFNPGNPFFQNKTRIVMNFTGQIQLWKWEREQGWKLILSEPKDSCSLYNRCGNFGSCNSNYESLCKCLPGFKPSSQWEDGDTSGGCIPISSSPNNRNDSSSDIFVQLNLMTVGNGTCSIQPNPNRNCTDACLKDSNCVAYSLGSDCSGTRSSSSNRCLIWSNTLAELQEDYLNGITLFLRTRSSDIEPTPGGCYPCGTYIIPYPLSTGSKCGDPSYLNFTCNSTIGQLKFSTSRGNFEVTNIDPMTQNFSIQVMPANSCDSRFINSSVLSDKDSSPFTFRSCKVVRYLPLLQVEHPFIEVEIGWNPPLGPVCNANPDCIPWPHTTCKAGHDGGPMRCTCGSKFSWNGLTLKCVRAHFPLKTVISCIAGALVIILVCSLIIVHHIRKRRMIKERGYPELNKDDTEGIDVPYFDWETILSATNNFADANKLGIGGFGSVYMGKLSDGQEIAVKRLSSVSVQGVEEFRTEVKLIAKLQHRNLVRLVGYCIKASEKILVYEYMRNGSLDSCLYDEKHPVDLDWKKRNDIILGIARGLLYLHQDSRLRIIHRDLKPSNILLDEELNPKISDFGIAKIVGGKETQASTGRIVGTYGYMSPEYASDGIFSVKSDVFSFGVVILETISGKRNSRIFMTEYGISLLGHAWKLWNDNRGMELMDPKLNESCSKSEVLKCIHIALLCVQEDPSDRPTMSTVVHMMSGENSVLPLAKQPAFMNRKPFSDSASSSSAKDIQDIMTISTVGR